MFVMLSHLLSLLPCAKEWLQSLYMKGMFL